MFRLMVCSLLCREGRMSSRRPVIVFVQYLVLVCFADVSIYGNCRRRYTEPPATTSAQCEVGPKHLRSKLKTGHHLLQNISTIIIAHNSASLLSIANNHKLCLGLGSRSLCSRRLALRLCRGTEPTRGTSFVISVSPYNSLSSNASSPPAFGDTNSLVFAFKTCLPLPSSPRRHLLLKPNSSPYKLEVGCI